MFQENVDLNLLLFIIDMIYAGLLFIQGLDEIGI